jgi:pimeloyl-ACP methyl ester carboxylesterase
MTSSTHPMPSPRIHGRTRVVLSAAGAALLVSACGGGGDGTNLFTTNMVMANAAVSCAALQGKTIAAALIGEPSTGAVVTSATFKPAVADAPNAAGTATVPGTPDYCQTLVDIRPVDPTAPVIKAQVNLPASWNRRSLQMGGGGLNGTLVTGLGPARADGPELPLPINRGYVTLGTDSGHQNTAGVDTAAFALNNEALVNYQYASYKKTRDVGVQLTTMFYGTAPLKAYYIGGSEGGREGMLMAQRYPADFDGIVVVDPVIRLIGLWLYQLSMGTVQSAPGTWLGGKIQLVQDTVAAACDGIDGLQDKIVSNYKACKPLADAALAARRCASGSDEGPACFSDGQLATLRWLQTGQTFPFALANGLTSYPGYLYGSEGVPGALDVWVVGTTRPGADPNAAGVGRSYTIGGQFVRYFVTRDPNFAPLAFDASQYQARIQELSNAQDMTNPDLSAFLARGGKLILRENLSDKGNAGQTGFDYYDAVVRRMGQAAVDQFFLAYGATGLPHTTSGLYPGAANTPSFGTAGQIDLLGMIDQWVVNGVKPGDAPTLTLRSQLAPFNLISSKPMCRYGSYPKYVGAMPSGGDQASNYTCTPM